MELLEDMLPEPVPSITSTKKKSKTKTGVKRALMLIIILTMMTIIHTIIQRLSDTNYNALFGQLFLKMNKIQNNTFVE